MCHEWILSSSPKPHLTCCEFSVHLVNKMIDVPQLSQSGDPMCSGDCANTHNRDFGSKCGLIHDSYTDTS